jgi:hypothetical protein
MSRRESKAIGVYKGWPKIPITIEETQTIVTRIEEDERRKVGKRKGMEI